MEVKFEIKRFSRFVSRIRVLHQKLKVCMYSYNTVQLGLAWRIKQRLKIIIQDYQVDKKQNPPRPNYKNPIACISLCSNNWNVRFTGNKFRFYSEVVTRKPTCTNFADYEDNLRLWLRPELSFTFYRTKAFPSLGVVFKSCPYWQVVLVV